MALGLGRFGFGLLDLFFLDEEDDVEDEDEEHEDDVEGVEVGLLVEVEELDEVLEDGEHGRECSQKYK